jgi:hypothetical protein
MVSLNANSSTSGFWSGSTAFLLVSNSICFTVGELTPHGPSTEWEVPEDEEWRTSPPVPATAYFDGLCEDLISLKMIPVPRGPDWDYWEFWIVPKGVDPEDRSSHSYALLTLANVSLEHLPVTSLASVEWSVVRQWNSGTDKLTRPGSQSYPSSVPLA